MRRALLIALVLAAPAFGQDADVTMTPEEHDAMQAYLACYYQQATAADDGAMDPATLARSVAPNYRGLLGAAADVFMRGESKAKRDALYGQWLTLEADQGVRTVEADVRTGRAPRHPQIKLHLRRLARSISK
jgi:hypothetical protein